MLKRRGLLLLAITYALTLAAAWYGLGLARAAVIADLDRPEVIAAWNADALRLSREEGRRASTAGAPPALILMRDYFAGIALTATAIVTFLFGFVALLTRRPSR